MVNVMNSDNLKNMLMEWIDDHQNRLVDYCINGWLFYDKCNEFGKFEDMLMEWIDDHNRLAEYGINGQLFYGKCNEFG